MPDSSLPLPTKPPPRRLHPPAHHLSARQPEFLLPPTGALASPGTCQSTPCDLRRESSKTGMIAPIRSEQPGSGTASNVKSSSPYHPPPLFTGMDSMTMRSILVKSISNQSGLSLMSMNQEVVTTWLPARNPCARMALVQLAVLPWAETYEPFTLTGTGNVKPICEQPHELVRERGDDCPRRLVSSKNRYSRQHPHCPPPHQSHVARVCESDIVTQVVESKDGGLRSGGPGPASHHQKKPDFSTDNSLAVLAIRVRSRALTVPLDRCGGTLDCGESRRRIAALTVARGFSLK
jgi:hypothetical protein